jgi:hypothetical protein
MLKINLLYFSEKHCGIVLVTQDVSDRRRDITLSQNSSRHLVEQWLEKMMVIPVDDRDVNVNASRALAANKPPKPQPTITTRCLTGVMFTRLLLQ